MFITQVSGNPIGILLNESLICRLVVFCVTEDPLFHDGVFAVVVRTFLLHTRYKRFEISFSMSQQSSSTSSSSSSSYTTPCRASPFSTVQASSYSRCFALWNSCQPSRPRLASLFVFLLLLTRLRAFYPHAFKLRHAWRDSVLSHTAWCIERNRIVLRLHTLWFFFKVFFRLRGPAANFPEHFVFLAFVEAPEVKAGKRPSRPDASLCPAK